MIHRLVRPALVLRKEAVTDALLAAVLLRADPELELAFVDQQETIDDDLDVLSPFRSVLLVRLSMTADMHTTGWFPSIVERLRRDQHTIAGVVDRRTRLVSEAMRRAGVKKSMLRVRPGYEVPIDAAFELLDGGFGESSFVGKMVSLLPTGLADPVTLDLITAAALAEASITSAVAAPLRELIRSGTEFDRELWLTYIRRLADGDPEPWSEPLQYSLTRRRAARAETIARLLDTLIDHGAGIVEVEGSFATLLLDDNFRNQVASLLHSEPRIRLVVLPIADGFAFQPTGGIDIPAVASEVPALAELCRPADEGDAGRRFLIRSELAFVPKPLKDVLIAAIKHALP